MAAVWGVGVGWVGAYAGAAVERASRIHRNDVYIARGEPPAKDVVWRPPWREFSGFAVVFGGAAGAITGAWWSGVVAGAAPAVLLLVTSAIRVARVHLAR